MNIEELKGYEEQLSDIRNNINVKLVEYYKIVKEYDELDLFFKKATALTLWQIRNTPGLKGMSRDRALAYRLGEKIESKEVEWQQRYDKYITLGSEIKTKEMAIDKLKSDKIDIHVMMKHIATSSTYGETN